MSENVNLLLTVNSVIDNLDDAGLADGDPEINIFTTEGSLSLSERGRKLAFTETSDGQTTSTTLYITEDKVLLQKRGGIESDMTFREGEQTSTVYRVGPYAFDMVVRTKRIRCSLDVHGGELQLLYTMNVGGQEKNVRMKITARESR